MKLKINLTRMLALMLAVSLLGIGTVYAVTEQGAYATLVFGVGALNQITVYQYTTSKGAMTAAGLALTNIEFNSTNPDAVWVNATVAGNSPQDATHPIVYVDNTGTTDAEININADSDITSTDACLKCRYIFKQAAAGVFSNTDDPATNGAGLNATQQQIDASFTPDEENWGVWLYGNFTGCTQGQDLAIFYINATFA